MLNLSSDIGDKKFPCLGFVTLMFIQSENTADLLRVGTGRCLEVSNHIIFAKTLEN